MTPTGVPDVYGVMGDPVSHSLSPRIHAAFAKETNENICYAAYPVRAPHLRQAIEGAAALGICGLNVTTPHKQTVITYLTQTDETADQIGAVNTICYLKGQPVGYNTDWIGMSKAMEKHGVCIRGSSVVIIGAGGSARAAGVMAGKQGAAKITIVNRTEQKARAMADLLQNAFSVPSIGLNLFELDRIKDKQIIIQTTSIGFGEQAGLCPIENEDFFEGADAVFDLIYSPWETGFLRMARAAGVKTVINGFSMLVYQAAASCECWCRKRPTDVFLSRLIETIAGEINQAGRC